MSAKDHPVRAAPTAHAERIFEARLSFNQQGLTSRRGSFRHVVSLICRGKPQKETRSKMAKAVTEIRSLARSHTRTALKVLVGVMRSEDATAAARVSAANAILDRGWGKAPQEKQNGSDGLLELIDRIERIIVHPENSDS